MFRKALEDVAKYTRPLVVCTRDYAGRVKGGVASFIVVNADGWALTAAHVFQTNGAYQQSQQQIADYDKKVAAIKANQKFSPQKKKQSIQQIPTNPDWITNVSYWWSHDGVVASAVHTIDAADLALVKLDNIPAGAIAQYPTFGKSANHVGPGDYLCKVGFPFNDVNVTYDSANDRFSIQHPNWPMFPIEGMITREVFNTDNAGNVLAKLIETSTPGLMGQSEWRTLG